MGTNLAKVGYGQIRLVSPYQVQTLKDLRMERTAGQHARLWVTGIISDEKQDECIELATSKDIIAIEEIDGEGNLIRTLFHGLVQQLSIRSSQGIYYLELEAVSHSILLDTKRRTRSFQNSNMACSQLIRSVVDAYEEADVLDYVTGTETLGKFTLQYDETDWSFLKRIASRFGGILIAEASASSPKIFVGVPGGKHWELDDQSYIIRRNLEEFTEKKIYSGHLNETDMTRYTIETGRWFNLGDKLRFHHQELTVISSIARLREGLMNYEYQIGPETGVHENPILNEKLTGASLEGKVLEIAKDTVRVHLDVDEEQEKHEASWIPYTSAYTAEGNSGLYLMPEIGDAIQVYFSSAREESAVATGSVRKGGQETAKMVDSSVKYWGTPYGKELKFGTSDLTLTATEGSLFITLKDSQGITIESDKGMKVSSKKDIKWTSEKKIDIEAKEALHLLCGHSSIIMDGETDIRGTHVQLVGLTKSPVFIEDLQPVPEAPFPTEAGIGSGQKSMAAIINLPANGEQIPLSMAGMIPKFGALAGSNEAAAQSALASIPTGLSSLNPILKEKLTKQAEWTSKLSGNFISMNPNIKERLQENASKPWLRSTESAYDRRKREREASLTTNKFWRPILNHTVVPYADAVDYVMEETKPGLFINRMSYSAASMFGSTGSSEPTTGNKKADKVADIGGALSSAFMNPSGVGVQGQSMWNAMNKTTAMVTGSKAGAFFQSSISKLLGNSQKAQNITKGVIVGTTAGVTQSMLTSMLQGKSSGKELVQALLSGGILGAGFGGLGGLMGPALVKLLAKLNLGKVYTDARQLASNWTKGKEISKLKQSMKTGIIEESPLVGGGKGKVDGRKFTGAGMKDYDKAAEAEYEFIRNLKMKDIEDVARNTGLNVDEIRTIKKHLFFGKHEIPQPGGKEFMLERFAPDDEIAFAWKTAQKGELSAEQKAWFKQLAEHELIERKLMGEGQKYRSLESWNNDKGTYDGYPYGAHENAPPQPTTTFPGYEQYYFKNMFK